MHSYDKEFLASLKTLSNMCRKTHQKYLTLYTDNQHKMFGAHLGFETLADTVENNHGYAKLNKNDKNLIDVLDFGKKLPEGVNAPSAPVEQCQPYVRRIKEV